jgi:DNA-binding transcriptional ArsR family regulator
LDVYLSAKLKLLDGVGRFAGVGLRVAERLAVWLHEGRIAGAIQDRFLSMIVPRNFALAEYLTLATLGDAAAVDGCGWSALSDVRASVARGSGEPAGACGWRTLSELRSSVAEGCIELTPDQADRLLRSLRRNGLIRQADSRQRRLYRITGVGVRVLLKIHDRLHAERPEFDQASIGDRDNVKPASN